MSVSEQERSTLPMLRVLGECEFEASHDTTTRTTGRAEKPLTPAQRRLLARLALSDEQAVTIEELSAAMWPLTPPLRHRETIHNQISRLRAAWGNDIILTMPDGYALGCHTDIEEFMRRVILAERLLETGDAASAHAETDTALGLVRGRPYADIDHLPEVVAARQPLLAAQRAAEDLRLETAIRLGRPVWAGIEAERLHAEDPLDERRQALRVRALLLAGRRGSALKAAAIARHRLRDELGVEPGPWLSAAEAEALGAVQMKPSGSPVPEPSQPYPVTNETPTKHDDLLRSSLDALDPQEAITMAREVALAANRNGEHRESVQWLTRALELPDIAAATRLILRIELGDAQRLAGDAAHLSTLIDAAREALDTDDEQATAAASFALLQLGASTTSGRPIPEVGTIIERALPRLTNPELRAPVLGAASLASSLIGVAARSRELFAEAEALPVSDETRARVLPFAYMALGAPADLELRTAAADELTDLAAKLHDPLAAFESAQLQYSVALQHGRGDMVRAAVASMAQHVGRVGDAGRQWALLFARAAVAHLDGEDERCEQLSNNAQQLFTQVSPARAAAAHAGQLIVLRLTQGRIAELAPTLTGLATAQPGIPAFQAAAALASAEIDPQAALGRAELALDLAQHDATWLAGHAIGARAAAILGNAPLCERYLERLEPWSGRGIWQGTCSYGPVDTPIAMLHRSLGDVAACAQHAELAREVAISLDAVPFVAELDRAGL